MTCWMSSAHRSSWASPLAAIARTARPTFVTLFGTDGAMELAKKLNNETCASLHREFGEKSAFLVELARELLVRRAEEVQQEGGQNMQLIKDLFSVNEILTVSLLGWFVAQVLKTIINFILLGKFQLERMWGDGGMPSAHSATVCAMVIATARSAGVGSSIFAVASVVAIITMHDAMGVRHETGEQAKVLNQMIEQWIDISEQNSPFLQNMHLKEMVGHTPLQVVARRSGRCCGRAPLPDEPGVRIFRKKNEKRRGAMNFPLLEKISQPSDLKKLSSGQVNQLCEEIRAFLLDHVSKTGGHLASNLGAVELTVALHRVLETPKDEIVFDVGHQCYTHKLLTGRREGFAKLRQLDGISGFPNPKESVHDAFVAGHGNTSLSLAIGMAWARKLRGEPGHVVAVIGDGSFTGGMVYEGMNNIGGLDNLLVVLNDNKMSISKNVGALARYFSHLRTTSRYIDAKENVRTFLDGVPVVGPPLKSAIQGGKSLVRRAMYHSTMFEDMGFHYFGPIDGHNEAELERALRAICEPARPPFPPCRDQKGQGLRPGRGKPRQLPWRFDL